MIRGTGLGNKTEIHGTSRSVISSSASPITLNQNSEKERLYIITDDVDVPTTWQMINVSQAIGFTAKFTISGGLHVQTFPDDWMMADARWDDVAKTWTPEDTGKYEAIGNYDSEDETWSVRIYGPDR